MRPAAVGFHCPDCVAEGARTQRQARTVAGGRVPLNPGRVTLGLIGLNVLVYLLVGAAGGSGSASYLQLVLTTASYPAYDVVGVDDGGWWRLLTSAFLHVQLLHLAFNMIALYTLGPPLERLVGTARFIAIYLICALAGSVAVVWLTSERTLTLGASGAVFGIFGAAIVLMRSRGYEVGSWIAVLGLNLVITFAIPGISWQGHLGGLVVGVALGLVLAYTPRQRRQVVHVGAFVTTTALLVGAVAAHALV